MPLAGPRGLGSTLAAVAAIVALVPAVAHAQPWIFSDGFEAGSLCLWSTAQPNAACGEIYQESFAGANGSPWPAPWTAVGGVDVADLQSGRARLRPIASGYSLARMLAPAGTVEIDLTFTFELEDEPTQGVGIYVRQNGGYLEQTNPPGQGYGVFAEGSFRALPGIGVWKEENGVEINLAHSGALAPTAGTSYGVRFRVQQWDATTTRLLTRIWPATDPEPFGWFVDQLDTTAVLQGVSGGLAVDSWSVLTGGIVDYTFVDDLSARALLNPLTGIGPVEIVSSTQLFAEGPMWRGDHLLFSDIEGDTIYRLDPPASITVFRTPSDEANGLAIDTNGDLLAAEHATRQVSRTDGGGVITTVVGTYQGMRFNSPNDIAVRSDGTIYFTDPDYGLTGPRELAFNGLFRLPPGGSLVAEWEGVPPDDEPNGVALSPDESVLYMADTASGEVVAWAVAPDGSLSNPRVFAAGLTIPDGLCVDQRGNLWIAAGNRIEVFSPEGAPWGGVDLPAAATNCAFGGADGRDLYVTARTHLLRIRTVVAGVI